MQFNGVDAEILDAGEVQALEPRLNFGQDAGAPARFPILGGLVQRRAGTLRHDAVAWGYARSASARGVHIVQNCPVTGFEFEGVRVVGVHTPHGMVRAGQVALAVAGHSSRLAALAGLRLPITSYGLQAMVTEPVKPVLNTVTLSPAVGTYWSQSDKGEVVIGGGIDPVPSYAQRGSFAVTQQVAAATLALFPSFSRLRLLRQWAGIVDIVHDSSPIIGATPVPGLLVNCGWGTGGFKAIPVGGYVLAHRLATGRDHELAAPFGLDRFRRGRLIDEAAAAGIAH
jgi:sarcosine oxidase subunit beta